MVKEVMALRAAWFERHCHLAGDGCVAMAFQAQRAKRIHRDLHGFGLQNGPEAALCASWLRGETDWRRHPPSGGHGHESATALPALR